MMTNPTGVHEQTAANIGAPLKLAMDARGCRTYQGGMRVQRSEQDQMRVEHYRRGEQGFELEVLKRPEEALHFEAVEFRIDLTRIYFDVTLQGKCFVRRRHS